MKPGDSRITTTIVRSGQPRPYADTERVVRLTFERVGYLSKNWNEWLVGEKQARLAARGSLVGFIDRQKKDAGPFDSYLDYMKPLEPIETSEEVRSAQWEFRVVSPYTD